MLKAIRTMAPGWFAAVMGTAVTALALTLLAQNHHSDFFFGAAALFHYAAIVLAFVLTLGAVVRIFVFPDSVVKVISDPVHGSFYATFPVSMLVMAGEWAVYGMPSYAVAALWWTGAAMTFVLSYMVLYKLFVNHKLEISMVTPAHFIPAVGLVVIPVAGATLAGAAQGQMREVYFAVNMLGFGAGTFMYVGLLALAMMRHFLSSPIEGKMTPTLWVHLAPLSVLPLSLLALLHAAGDVSAFHYGTLMACGFLGAGLWWFVLAAILTVRNWRLGKLPFALSWWAFIFPIGALSVLCIRLSAILKLGLLPMVAHALVTILVILWAVAAIGTIRDLLKPSAQA